MSSQPGPPAQPAEPGKPRRSRRANVIAIAILLVIVGGLVALVIWQSADDASNAKVGDCIEQTGGDSVAVIACEDPDATFRVVGRLEDRSQVDAGLFACSDFEGAEQSYWEGEQGENGFILCLAPIK